MRRTRINVGLDFGTSTTKVCARESRGFSPDLEVYPIKLCGDDQLLCPSLVVVANGRLYFGDEAQRREAQFDAMTFSHLKSCLACEAEYGGERLPDCRSSCNAHGACEGRFLVGSSALRPSDLTTCFLAWAFRRSRELLPRSLAGSQGTDFTYHVGVPVGQLERRSPLGDLYQRVTWNAFNLSGEIKQGCDLDVLIAAVRTANEAPLPAEGESPVQLSPEAGAAAVSWLYAPETAPGIYGVVDVGAWTTDVAFFRRNDEQFTSDGQVFIEFFSADSHRFAASEVDRRCHARLVPASSDFPSLAEVRAFREADSSGDSVVPAGGQPHPWGPVLHEARREVAEEIIRGFRRTIKQGQRKQLSAERWRGFSVFMVGGGALERALWTRISDEDLPGRVAPAPSFSIVDVEDPAIQRRLAIAVGLAIPQPLWPRIYAPSDVEDDRPLKKREIPWSKDPGLD